MVHREAPDEWHSIASTREWDAVVRLIALHPSAVLSAEGEMTDEVLAEVSEVATTTGLNLGGSKCAHGRGRASPRTAACFETSRFER